MEDMGGFHDNRADLPDPDDKVDEPSDNQKRKTTDADTDGYHEDPDAKSAKRIMLLLTKPSYAMNQRTESLRSLHRCRLRVLLARLIREHNWKEACGVMSVYLLATVALKRIASTIWMSRKDRQFIRSSCSFVLTMVILRKLIKLL